MFKKILIANRGEIACRIARTAKKMGIVTVAVYSDADVDAMHVEECDEAIHIGPAPAGKSYLNAERILEAIHPGYGFLSENPAFAEQCFDRNITFIGPSATAIRSMGSKSTARKIIATAGIPVLPGYDDENQDTQVLVEAARTIGYPLLIKAVSGGGGKGMRVVNHADELAPSLEAVKRESKAAFGDEQVLLERYLRTARHIEIQIFSDTHGNVVHLFERDCSAQRRHQKVIEEAPAPMMSPELRDQMGQAAVKCAKAISYWGAGTIEFLLSPNGKFYFMEMNTRLQVEHPVTELITGQDLVRWQLLVAQGACLPLKQEELSIHGHAIEARIYAENPALGFLPATGMLHHVTLPITGEHIRIDTGVRQGDQISVHYDPMISKLIVWGEDRPTALKNLSRALDDYCILGVQNNISFLSDLTAHPVFAQGCVDTRFIENRFDELSSPSSTETLHDIALLVSCYDLIKSRESTRKTQQQSQDPFSPWGLSNHWQNQLHGNTHLYYTISDTVNISQVTIDAWSRQNELCICIESDTPKAHSLPEIQCEVWFSDENNLIVKTPQQELKAILTDTGSELLICHDNRNWQIHRFDPRAQENNPAEQNGQLTAPMPGTVVAVMVNEGDVISEGNPLIIVEAMKMEHQINAPNDGTVGHIYFTQGDQVNEGDTLLTIDGYGDEPA